MNIVQNGSTGVIKWESFDVGGSATVNFSAVNNGQDISGYHTLNYVNGGNMSQIYGTINAKNDGNIYIVNPAGVQIGNSAQINVGSLYVSTNELNDADFTNFINKAGTDTFALGGTRTAAELMSLGNINANKVTFEGDGRIVIDTERLKDADKAPLTADQIIVTGDEDSLVIGYEGYDEANQTYAGANPDSEAIATVNDHDFNKNQGYMWVEDAKQLQAINTNLGGNYALRNSIDATIVENFNPIGLDTTTGKVQVTNVNNQDKYGFYGKFDGIDYNIFGLTIDRSTKTNVGLFGVAHDAEIRNVTLVGGSITGGSVVGSVVGAAIGDTHISNATNSAAVTGGADVGGIVGYTGNEIKNIGEDGNTAPVTTDATFDSLVNTGTITSTGAQGANTVSNAGGLIGYMYNGTLSGNSYNLGNVSGDGYNVGGLVGHAVHSVIGNVAEEGKDVTVVYNRLGVTGAYNVGGIVGNMEGTTVQNAENSGTVTATGYDTETYTYHTAHYAGGIMNEDVYVANIGGIAGTSSAYENQQSGERWDSHIEGVINTGDVGSVKAENQSYYQAGNVGGIVGKAVDTDIENATNRENEIRGAHNVGGIAGYFGNSDDTAAQDYYHIMAGSNDGGDIMATGARNDTGFVREWVRRGNDGNENFIIGNIGGIAGYVDGDHVSIADSANRGTVHTSNPVDPEQVQDFEKAANVGGIAGKIDTANQYTVDKIQNGAIASVTNSYNTGDVLGYTGVGGVVGMMYNGAVTQSYNLGNIQTTRRLTGAGIDPVNMGGVVGDTTEGTDASALLYDVYNKGQIGDETFTYFARHVGGIVGRLSGTVEKAYNTGDIYNNDTTVGGIAGWWYNGIIKDVFNTGNITVRANTELQVGGLVGASSDAVEHLKLSYAYNLGTIRGYQDNPDISDSTKSGIYVGGIIGRVRGMDNLTIDTVYTLGNLYAGRTDGNGAYTSLTDNLWLGPIYGGPTTDDSGKKPELYNVNYVKPESENGFNELTNKALGQGANVIEFADRYDGSKYQGFEFSTQNGGAVIGDEAWRIYEDSLNGTTPILNAFLPHMEGYFEQYENDAALNGAGIDSIQYGTAYDPLLTIVNANQDLEFSWDELGLSGGGSLAVYDGALTLNGVATGNSYYSGLLYSDDALTLNHADGEDLRFSAAADLYGSSVAINADGSSVIINGDVVATGQKDAGEIDIIAGEVDVYGTLTAVGEGESLTIPGISDHAGSLDFENIDNPYAVMPHIGDRFSYTTEEAVADSGNITITATADKDNSMDGDVNLYFGNKGEGLITAGKDLTVTADGDVFVDSDLDIAGNMKLTSKGKDGEVLLTLTNIGKVQADRIMAVIERAVNGMEFTSANENALVKAIYQSASGVDKAFTGDDAITVAKMLIDGGGTTETFAKLNEDIAVEYMHDFMHSFEKNPTGTQNRIDLNAASGDAKITVDMWVDNGDGTGKYDFKKYDSIEHTFQDELDYLEVYVNGDKIEAAKTVYVEVSTGEQLKGIQEYAGKDGTSLQYNYALMGDIDASRIEGYEAIGGKGTYNGVFDGRGNRIIGLNVDGDNAGLFSTVGADGTVKDVNIYSAVVNGTATAGAVAGVNNGRIEGVVTFGNTVQVQSDGNAGGIVGINKGAGKFTPIEDAGDGAPVRLEGQGLFDVESTGIVNSGANNAVIGGIVGTNEGALGYSFSDSAVTGAPTKHGFGGVVGHNTSDGRVWYVDSLGVTNGGTRGSYYVGGVIGYNEGNLNSAYNESIVSGYQYVGGIIGSNSNTSTLTNAVNAAAVTGRDQEPQAISKYVGGLIGSNGGNVTNGRNNGEITGNQYVGGLVGSNEAGSTLTNLVNDSSASITGEWYVGGIAGSNAGTITATNEDAGDEEDDSKLINRGTITGQQYVGGVAGLNTGTISNTNNDISLNVRHEGQTAEYFGGVAGQNKGTITNATNEANIEAEKANYVGGIVGHNAESGVLSGMGNSNEGHVVGNQYVGGVIGKNEGTIGESGKVTTVVNAGTVEALEGGAGGIVAYNNGDIINTKLTNAGNVSSKLDVEEAGTGGIFGYNEGDITGSVLENVKGFVISEGKTSDGHVSGTVNVGGLIGYNKGDITESTLRNEADITIEPKTGETAQNIGGLIGKNEGKITGGRNEETSTVDADSYYKYQIYNNGTITVTGEGENVGGLIGYNAVNTDANRKGSLDAAYNTGAIVANNSQNVGGLVGNNEGTVSQVFNTVLGKTDPISGNINVGGLIGTNFGSLDNAYNTTGVSGHNAVGNAVGVNAGTVTNVLDVTNTDNTLIGDNQGQVTGSYTSSLVEANGSQGITYISEEGKLAQNSYGSLTDDGTWRFYDGYSTPLLKVFLTTLKVDGDNVDITYNAGEQDLNIGQLVHDKVITAPNAEAAGPHDAFDGFAAYDNTKKEDGLGESPLLDNTTGQKNAGRYDNWLFSQQIAASGDGDSFNPNNLGYDIVYTNDKGIEVKKATLDIVLDDISRVYGSGTIQNSTVGSIRNDQGYGYTFDSEMTEEMKKELADSLKFTVTDDGAINNLEPGKTNNVGDDYKWSAQFTLTDDLGENYQFAGGSTLTGNSSVTKADLYIQANDENIALGGTPNFTGSVNQFVNGDSFNVSFGTDKDWTSTAGRYEGVIGFWGDDGNFYNASGFISDTFFGGNYNVYFTPGTLTVGTMPDIPAWEFPGGRWDYLYNDAPFDRNRDFRERKAEINFVDGGMEI